MPSKPRPGIPAHKGKNYREKHLKGRPGRGGPQPGSGDATKKALDALKRLDTIKYRLPPGCDDAEVELASQSRQTIYDVMMNPRRHAQVRLGAAVRLLDEMCGKLEDRLKLEDGKVIVEIKQTPRAEPVAAAVAAVAPVLTVVTKPEGEGS